jgi:hypothetical protein
MTMNEAITIDGQAFGLTTEHAASSYGIPVLVGGDGAPLGTADTCRLRVEAASDEAVAALAGAGYAFDDCR